MCVYIIRYFEELTHSTVDLTSAKSDVGRTGGWRLWSYSSSPEAVFQEEPILQMKS